MEWIKSDCKYLGALIKYLRDKWISFGTGFFLGYDRATSLELVMTYGIFMLRTDTTERPFLTLQRVIIKIMTNDFSSRLLGGQ